MPESVGTFDRLFLDPTASGSYTAVEFLPGSTLGLSEQFLDPSGIRGVRGHQSERVRRGLRQTGGTLLFNPTPADLDLLLPWILGTAESSDTFALGETVPEGQAKVSRDGTWHLYDQLFVNRATFTASEGTLVQLAVEVVGVDEASTTSASGSIADATQPYVMTDAVLTVGVTGYGFRSFELAIDNHLEVRHNNSAVPITIHATDRTVSVALGVPYGDGSALYGSALGGVAVSLALTNGNTSLTFAMPKVQAPRSPLEVGNRASRTMAWQGVARRSGSSAELVVTSDSSA